jgi:hypothetical protein
MIKHVILPPYSGAKRIRGGETIRKYCRSMPFVRPLTLYQYEGEASGGLGALEHAKVENPATVRDQHKTTGQFNIDHRASRSSPSETGHETWHI